MPVLSAAGLPPLGCRMHPHVRAGRAPRRCRAVPSVEPSSTTITSTGWSLAGQRAHRRLDVRASRCRPARSPTPARSPAAPRVRPRCRRRRACRPRHDDHAAARRSRTSTDQRSAGPGPARSTMRARPPPPRPSRTAAQRRRSAGAGRRCLAGGEAGGRRVDRGEPVAPGLHRRDEPVQRRDGLRPVAAGVVQQDHRRRRHRPAVAAATIRSTPGRSPVLGCPGRSARRGSPACPARCTTGKSTSSIASAFDEYGRPHR